MIDHFGVSVVIGMLLLELVYQVLNNLPSSIFHTRNSNKISHVELYKVSKKKKEGWDMINFIATVIISILLMEIVWLALNDSFVPFAILGHVLLGIVIGHCIWSYITYLRKRESDET